MSQHNSHPWSLALGLVAVLGATSCSGGPRPKSLPPQTVTPLAAPTAAEESVAETFEPPVEAAQEAVEAEDVVQEEVAPPPRSPVSSDSTLVVISSQPRNEEAEVTPEHLFEASRAERRRRQQSNKAVAVINNKTLAKYAEGSRLTYADAPSAAFPDTPEASAESERGESYWRRRGHDLRLEWHETVEEIQELKGKVAQLRRQFYAEDDPYVRDSQIKPEWDRALERLDQAMEREENYPILLEEFLNEGRQAGALPGWLREGAELEPQSAAEDEIPEAEPGEPQVVNEKPRDP